MSNPTIRRHPPGAVVGCVLLALFSALVGVWLAWGYDVLRVSVLDNALANQLGYIGEITDATPDPRPHGISREVMPILFITGVIGWPIGYAWAVVSRREIGDPDAIPFALGIALIGGALGFAWLSLDGTRTEPGDLGVVAQLVRYGTVWIPVLMAGLAVLLLLAWRADPDDHDEEASDEHTA